MGNLKHKDLAHVIVVMVPDHYRVVIAADVFSVSAER